MNATSLDFKTDYPSFPEFAKYGIPLELVDADFILFLQEIRNNSGVPIQPSPVRGGWARTDGSTTSRHYAVGRLSDAGDLFPARGRFVELFHNILKYHRTGGVGIYADTNGPDGKPWPMLHLDMRSGRVIWGRDKVYCTQGVDNKGFNRILRNIIDLENR